ncbi:hypothetical protein F7P83_08175 [Brevibacterium luteolum]|nr:hypothetical protein [Brevibacterium luteolum]
MTSILPGIYPVVKSTKPSAVPGACEDVESELATAFYPFVVLLGQNGTDEADNAGSVGEDPDPPELGSGWSARRGE